MQAAPAASSLASAPKAGWWIRFLAIFIDGIILYVINFIIGTVVGRTSSLAATIQLVLGIVYYTYLWSESSPWPGQTIGDKLLNIRVIKTDGSNLSITTALIRYVGLVISVLVIFIGVIWAAFDPQKQGWHDKIAGTYVVKAS